MTAKKHKLEPLAGACSTKTSHKSIENSVTVIRPEMCYYCFEVLECHLFNHSTPSRPHFTDESFPLFVTWKIGKDKKLRGCIGTFSDINLHHGLKEYAITSAIRDSRFSPIAVDEFPRLSVSVSLLTNFEKAESYLDWEVGIHGIRIEFLNERGQKKTATYLPEVAREQGWNHDQTVDSLLRKGGFKGTITNDIRFSVKLTRYKSEKTSVSYTDYICWRQTHNPNYQSNHHHRKNGETTSKSFMNGFHRS